MRFLSSLTGLQKAALFLTLAAAGFNLMGEESVRSTFGIALLGLAVTWAAGVSRRVIHLSFLLSGISLSVGPMLLDWRHRQEQVVAHKQEVERFESNIPRFAELYPLPRLLERDVQEAVGARELLAKSGDPRARDMDVLVGSFLVASTRKAYPAAYQFFPDAELLSSMLANCPEYRALTFSPDLVKSVAAFLDRPSVLKPSLKVRDVLLNPFLNKDLTPAEGHAVLQTSVPGFADLPNNAQEKVAVLLDKWPPSPALIVTAPVGDSGKPWMADALAAGIDLERVPENEKPGDAPALFSPWRSVVKLHKFVIGGLMLACLGLGSLVSVKRQSDSALARSQEGSKEEQETLVAYMKLQEEYLELKETLNRLSEAYGTVAKRLSNAPASRPLLEAPLASSGHIIRSVSDDGAVIILDDGSVWQVDPLSWTSAALWQPFDKVHLTPDGHMTQAENGEKVLVRQLQ